MLFAHTPRSPRSRRGFTLVELLVAVGLATILISTVVLIFYGSTDIFKTSEARMTVFGNARAALDIFARDLQSCLPIESGQQRFVMHNAGGPGSDTEASLVPGGLGTALAPTIQAIDDIQFRAIIPVVPVGGGAPTLRTVHVLYSLRQDSDPELLGGAGTQTSTVRTNRFIYILQKRIYDPAALGAGGTVAVTTDPGPPLPVASPELDGRADLCHYVLSMNLEYVYYTALPATPPIDCFAPNTGPITGLLTGAGLGANPPGDPRLPLGIRISLRVTEGAGERQERLLVRTVWIPLS